MPVFSGGRSVPARPVRPTFRDPRFVFLLAGQSLNWVGSWAGSLVLWGFAAYRFGASPEAISVTALCWTGPPVVLTAFTGGLTDRFGPRVMLIVGYTCSAVTSLGMAVAGSMMFLDVMAVACGAARSLCSPASSALPTRVVESDDLLAANSLLGVTASIGQVAGPLAASVLMAATGFRVAFAADAATYLVGVLVIFPLPTSPAAGRAARGRGSRHQAFGIRGCVVAQGYGGCGGGGPRSGIAPCGDSPDGGDLHVRGILGHRAALHPARAEPAGVPVRAVRGGDRDRGDRDRPGAPGHSPPRAGAPVAGAVPGGRRDRLRAGGGAVHGHAVGSRWPISARSSGASAALCSTRPRPRPCSGSLPRGR